MKLRSIFGIIFISLFSSVSCCGSQLSTMPVNIMIPVNIKQDAFAFIPETQDLNASLLSESRQKYHRERFLARYYGPWNIDDSSTESCATANGQRCSSILEYQQDVIQQYSKDPGHDKYYRKHKPTWINDIITNSDLNTFPNKRCSGGNCYGIMVDNAALRTLPTDDPSYTEISQPGEGYPFDNLQMSGVHLATPVHILHESKDRKWLLIKTHGLFGWVKREVVGLVDQEFITSWKKHNLSTLLTQKASIKIDPNDYRSTTVYLGTLLPIIGEVDLLVPQRASNGWTELKAVPMPNNQFHAWPLTPTVKNFGELINQILGTPYGWGDVGFNPDCSSMLRYFYSAFGIWLPRNSAVQAHYAGDFYGLPISQYSVTQRKAIFLEETSNSEISSPQPFLTLISSGHSEDKIGHITMYLGKSQNDIVLFQSNWGMSLVDEDNNSIGRAIIGRAVITEPDYIKNFDFGNRQLHAKTRWEAPEFNITEIK